MLMGGLYLFYQNKLVYPEISIIFTSIAILFLLLQ